MLNNPTRVGLIDSHCHLNYLQHGSVEGVSVYLDRARVNNVTHCLCISVDLKRIAEVLAIAAAHDNVKASVGVHPCDVHATPQDTMQQLCELATGDQVVAIGETGLDYYHEEHLDKALQHRYFCEHIQLSMRLNKPLIVHTRAAREDTIAILKTEGCGRARGVMHCFSESLSMAKQALDLGFYISFSGILTFKNAEALRDVCRYCPLDRILVETDAPYLAPVPFRGKPNEPAYVHYVAEQVAALKGVTLAHIAEQTTANFARLFGWPHN